ncbi:MAG: hypothetical protein NTX53_06640 [candidate division WOR-3 bacterium]|nr:hypothetical protein [candidate division WOR-3 bacterium]
MKLILVAAFALLALLSAGCDKELPDTVPPVISWVAPQDGDIVDPGAVGQLVVVAADDRRMGFVVFFAGVDMLGMVTTAGADTYRITVECPADVDPVIHLRAFAYDDADNGTSADITVRVRQ